MPVKPSSNCSPCGLGTKVFEVVKRIRSKEIETAAWVQIINGETVTITIRKGGIS